MPGSYNSITSVVHDTNDRKSIEYRQGSFKIPEKVDSTRCIISTHIASLYLSAASSNHEYVIKIVPTIYEDLSGSKLAAYQYTYAYKGYATYGRRNITLSKLNITNRDLHLLQFWAIFFQFISNYCEILGIQGKWFRQFGSSMTSPRSPSNTRKRGSPFTLFWPR